MLVVLGDTKSLNGISIFLNKKRQRREGIEDIEYLVFMYIFWTFDLLYHRTEGYLRYWFTVLMSWRSQSMCSCYIGFFFRFLLFTFYFVLLFSLLYKVIIYYFTYLPAWAILMFFICFSFFTLMFSTTVFLLGNYILCLTYQFTLHCFYHGEVNQFIHGRELNFRFYRIEPCVIDLLIAKGTSDSMMGLAWSSPSAPSTACLLHLA